MIALEAAGDVAERVVRRRRGPLAVGSTAHGVRQTIRVVVHVERGDALVAGEALRHRMVLVGAQRGDPPGSTVATSPHDGSQILQNVLISGMRG